MKRLFTALKILPGSEFLSKYRELQHALHHEQIKWVEDHNIHVTLKFLGETEERKLPEVCSLLAGRASMTRSFSMQLSGLGIFGSSYAPKVIWVGIEPFAELSDLMRNIQNDLKAIGFEPDRQNLVPHLTLGRIKFLRDKVIFTRTIDQFKVISSPTMLQEEMILFESILRRDGPQYIDLNKFRFIKKELP